MHHLWDKEILKKGTLKVMFLELYTLKYTGRCCKLFFLEIGLIEKNMYSNTFHSIHDRPNCL